MSLPSGDLATNSYHTTTMKNNPFTKARRDKRIKTIGQAIDALVEAFSAEDSGDIMGSYILEQAAAEAKKRQPQRQAEWDAVMARIDASIEKEKATRTNG
jgi:hypothetical protein